MSEITFKHYGHVSDGQLYLTNVELYMENLKLLNDKQVELVVQEKHEDTTPSEHGFYRGGILKIMLQHESFGGWTSEELHTYLSDRFLGETVEKEIRGIITSVRIVPSTANIGKKRMARYITDVINWLTTIGIEIQDPSAYSIQKYYGTKKNEKES